MIRMIETSLCKTSWVKLLKYDIKENRMKTLLDENVFNYYNMVLKNCQTNKVSLRTLGGRFYVVVFNHGIIGINSHLGDFFYALPCICNFSI